MLRSPTEPSYNTDSGRHTIKYALYPHKGDLKVGNVVRRSYEFSNPLIALLEGKRTGVLGKTGSFINVEPENVIVECIKKADDDKNLILRLYEYTEVKNQLRNHIES